MRRKCDGYAGETGQPPLQTTSTAVAAPGAMLMSNAGSFEERRALDFFCHYTAQQFPGLFLDDFWCRLLQLSNIEPAIRHAMIAVGSIHEQYETYMTTISVAGSVADTSHRFAVTEYNKATSSLVKRLSADSNSVLTTIVACLLFISLEFLRGEVDQALTHLQSGLNILSNWREGPRASTESSTVEEVLPVFERLSMTSSLFGRPAYQLYTQQIDPATLPSSQVTFDGLPGARKSLVGLVNVSLQFIQSVLRRKNRLEVTFEDVVRQNRLENLLRQWEQSFEALTGRQRWSLPEQNSITLLRIHQRTILIWLLTSLLPNETSYDLYNANFEHVINMATEELVDSFANRSPQGGRASNFSFEMQLIAPIYFLAIKCRVGWIRRKAITHLYKMASKEGPWDSIRSAKVAERVVVLEEAGIDRSAGQDLPPEWSRIHHADIKCDKHPTTGQQLVEFLSKPNGEWKTRQEYLVLS
ncbi:hypothetical protein GP486_005126 [Trichoglossum hirsutum]|uniref:C6 zinc finger domain protein n=1 Tax=Trichoglossum hirsutum TaxID=265104 RepID=A0A9P8L9T1_9PEZI|nr:hypothetical protein GP486_005126 [Trichoglossum hirsutum]